MSLDLLERAREGLRIAQEALEALEATLAAPKPAEPAPASPVPLAAGLCEPGAFFASLRASDAVFGGRLTAGQVAGCERLCRAGAGRLPRTWMAYCLATSYHETGHLMTPVRERGSGDGPDLDPWDDYLQKYDTGRLAKNLGNTPEADGDGVKWAGRGDVQLTGARNYTRADAELARLGLIKAGELLANPDLALRPDLSAAIMVSGMLQGWFTGKKLNDYVPMPAERRHFANARRIINGTDRADLIAGYAVAFDAALKAGEWA